MINFACINLVILLIYYIIIVNKHNNEANTLPYPTHWRPFHLIILQNIISKASPTHSPHSTKPTPRILNPTPLITIHKAQKDISITLTSANNIKKNPNKCYITYSIATKTFQTQHITSNSSITLIKNQCKDKNIIN